MQEKITIEQATAEINAWMDCKRLPEAKRTANASSIEELINAIMAGELILTEENKLVYSLRFPVEDNAGNVVLDKLEFKPRLNVGAINERLKGVKATDVDGRMLAYAAALTDQSLGMLGKLDTGDMGIVQNIVVFFF